MASVDTSAQAGDCLFADMSEPPDDEALRMEEAMMVAELFGEQSDMSGVEEEDCQVIQLPPKRLLQTTLGQMFWRGDQDWRSEEPFQQKDPDWCARSCRASHAGRHGPS